jgi:hypothetical protein
MDMSPFKPESETEPQAATEEELFCDYLAARLQQALDVLDEARNDLTGKPQDVNRAAQVMRRVHELRDLKKQLELQRKRVDATRAAVGMEPLPRAETRATVEFRAVQAEQAEKIMAALSAQPRTCPSCQSPILSDAEQCNCGHATASPAQQENPLSSPEPLT